MMMTNAIHDLINSFIGHIFTYHGNTVVIFDIFVTIHTITHFFESFSTSSKITMDTVYSDTSANHILGIAVTSIVVDGKDGYHLHNVLITNGMYDVNDIITATESVMAKLPLSPIIKKVHYYVIEDGTQARSTRAERVVFDVLDGLYKDDEEIHLVTDSYGVQIDAEKYNQKITVSRYPGHGKETPHWLKYVDTLSRRCVRMMTRKK